MWARSPIRPKKQDNRKSSGGWGLETTGERGVKTFEKGGRQYRGGSS